MADLPDTLYARTLRALQDATACPACTTTLRAGRCDACGLDVSGPDGVQVWQDSQAVVRALTVRQQRVAALRAAQARAAAPHAVPANRASARAATSATVPPATVPTHPRDAGPRVPAPHTAVVTAPPARDGSATDRAAPPRTGPAAGARSGAAGVRPAAPQPSRHRWRVQTVLQVVGAALLVAASITFLVFAWDVMGLRARAAVVAVGTLVVFALASWLRSRRLTQGAEAVGAVAVVLLLLDAWALRATDVLAIGTGPAQAGVSALVCAALLTAWGLRSRLRVGSVAGAVLVPLAPLAWLPAVPDAAGAAALLLLTATSTTLRALPPWVAGSAERGVLRAAAALALPAATLTGLGGALTVLDTGPARYLALLMLCAGVLALQTATEARTTRLGARAQPAWPGRGARLARPVWAAGAGVVTVLTAATAAAAAVAPVAGALVTAQAATVGACLVTAALLAPRARTAGAAAPADDGGAAAGRWRGARGVLDDVRTAGHAGLVAAAAATTGSATLVVASGGAALAGSPTSVPAGGAAALLALATAAGLGVLAARRTRRRTARAVLGATRALVVLVAVAVPVLSVAGPLVSPVGVTGEALVVGLLLAARRGPLGRPAARTGAVLAASLAVLCALPHPAWSAVALLIPAALAVVARSWWRAPLAAAASTAAAATLLLTAAATGGPAVGLPAGTAAALAVPVVAGALLARATRAGAAPDGGGERDAALVAAALATCVVWFASAGHVVAGAPGGVRSPLVTAAPLVAAAAALAQVAVLLRAGSAWGARHVAAAAAAAAPAAALTAVTVHAVLGAPDGAGTALLVTVLGVLAPVCAPLVGAVGGRAARHAAEASGAVVVACGIAAAAGTGSSPLAAALLVAAVGSAVWGLAPGRGPAWWVALALATSAWWVLLAARDLVVVEPYTVPPGLVVATVGAWRVARRRPGAPALLVAGLALATLPTAALPAVLEVASRWVDRGLVTAVTAVAVVVAALLLTRRRPATAELLAGLGALLVVVGPLARAVSTAAAGAAATSAAPTGPVLPDGTVAVEAWAWPATVALAACAGVVRSPRVRAVLDRAGPWVLLAAATAPSFLTVLATTDSPSAAVRATSLALAAATLAVLGGVTGHRALVPGARRAPDAPGPDADPSPAPTGARVAALGLALLVPAAAAGTAVLGSPRPDGATRGGLPRPLPDTLPDALGTVLDLPTLGAALVALATVALVARRGAVPVVWAAAGVLGLVPSLLVRDAAGRPVLWALTAVVLLAAARLVGPPARWAGRWAGRSAGTAAPTAPPRPTHRGGGHGPRRGRARGVHDVLPPGDVARLLTGTALVVAVAGPWVAALVHGAGAGPAAPWRVELVAALTWLVGLRHARTSGDGSPRPALRTALVVLLVLPSVLATDASALGTARACLVLAGGAALAWWASDRFGAVLGLGAAAAGTAALALRGGPEPVDVPWTVLGLVALALGLRRMLRDPVAPSWRALGVPVALTLGAPLAALLVAPAGWRLTVLVTLGLAAVVTGAARRWQAPFLLGAGAVLTTLVVVLSPVAADALAAVDGWVLLAVGGALVLGLGVTYEQRVQDAREAVRFVGEMR